MNHTKDCVFIDESAFDINIKLSIARSARGTPAVVTTPSAKAVSHTILGAICLLGVVNMESSPIHGRNGELSQLTENRGY